MAEIKRGIDFQPEEPAATAMEPEVVTGTAGAHPV